MSGRTLPAVLAVGFGALIVLAALVPVVATAYRRRGRFGPRELAVAVAVPVYGLAVLTYTLLPLPAADAASCAAHADMLNLRPFGFVDDIVRIAGRQQASGPRAWLGNAAVQQVVLNVALFVPLGWLVRGPGRRSIVVATLAGFGVSLLVEATQYTGNWYLFPCPYRIADVDDLIANTAGALLGAVLAALLRPRSWDAADPDRPRPVTVSRRLLGDVCDLLAVMVGGFVLGVVLLAGLFLAGVGTPYPGWVDPATTALAVWLPVVVFFVAPLCGRGGTVGQRAVRLRPATSDGSVPAPPLRFLRAVLGIGGVFLLSLPSGQPGLLALLWAAASVIGIVVTTGHTGIAGRITGLTMVDAREPAPEPATSRT